MIFRLYCEAYVLIIGSAPAIFLQVFALVLEIQFTFGVMTIGASLLLVDRFFQELLTTVKSYRYILSEGRFFRESGNFVGNFTVA